jgi:hypothetical protein
LRIAARSACTRFLTDRKNAVEHQFMRCWQLGEADDACRLCDRQTSGKGVFLLQ